MELGSDGRAGTPARPFASIAGPSRPIVEKEASTLGERDRVQWWPYAIASAFWIVSGRPGGREFEVALEQILQPSSIRNLQSSASVRDGDRERGFVREDGTRRNAKRARDASVNSVPVACTISTYLHPKRLVET